MHRQSTNINLRSQSKPKENTNRPKTTVVIPQASEKTTVQDTPGMQLNIFFFINLLFVIFTNKLKKLKLLSI